MKIQAISDLHLEFRDYEIKNNGADVLVLAGDILVSEAMRKTPYDAELTEDDMFLSCISEESHIRRMAVRYRSFLKKCSKEFDHVIYVAGNHEFYNGKWNQSIDVLRTECERYTNIHFLDDEIVNIDGVNFIGGTLWTDYNGGCPTTKVECQLSMNDYRKITDDSNGSYSRLNPNRVEQKNRKTVEYISFMTKEIDAPFVVVTHHSPSFQSVHPNYQSQHHMNGAYHNNLDDLIHDRENIKAWIHGHTHNAMDYMIGQCRVVCNPRGYPRESSGCDENLILEVDY